MLRKKLLPAIVCTGFLVSACVPAVETTQANVAPGGVSSSTISSVQRQVRERMKDPESAKFRNTKTYHSRFGDKIVCGEYDARNSFGGYTGYDSYYFRLRGGQVMASFVDSNSTKYYKPAAETCSKAAKGSITIPADQYKS